MAPARCASNLKLFTRFSEAIATRDAQNRLAGYADCVCLRDALILCWTIAENHSDVWMSLSGETLQRFFCSMHTFNQGCQTSPLARKEGKAINAPIELMRGRRTTEAEGTDAQRCGLIRCLLQPNYCLKEPLPAKSSTRLGS